MFIGETIALGVAVAWTATAMFAEVGSKRMGSLPLNTVRMTMSLTLLFVTLWLTMGVPYPRFADGGTWLWLLLSGVVGYVIGDYCLMQGYIFIGSRFGQLFMTLSAPTAALTGRLLLGEQMRPLAIVGMVVTLSGIALSILSKKDNTVSLGLPAKGVFFAAMAGICQGFGLVLSKIGLQHYDAAVAAAAAVFEHTLRRHDDTRHHRAGRILPAAGGVQQRLEREAEPRGTRPQGHVVRVRSHHLRTVCRCERVAAGHAVYLDGYRTDAVCADADTHHSTSSVDIPSKSHRKGDNRCGD